jgi:hypothetical protein
MKLKKQAEETTMERFAGCLGPLSRWAAIGG